MGEVITLDPQTMEALAGVMQLRSPLEAALAKFNEPKPAPEVKPEVKPPADVAPMAEGIAGGLASFELQGLPIGQAAVGGFVAVMATELIDGFLAKQNNLLRAGAKGLVALGAMRYGTRVLGSVGAKAVALFVLYDALRDVVPFDTLAKNLTARVSGVLPTRGLAQGSVREAERVLRNAQGGIGASYYQGVV